MSQRRVQSIDSLYDFIGYVVLCAPSNFPIREYLAPESQMDLERAFAELRHGVSLVEQDFPGADHERGLTALLERALESYRRGDEVAGAHRLQEFQAAIFKG